MHTLHPCSSHRSLFARQIVLSLYNRAGGNDAQLELGIVSRVCLRACKTIVYYGCECGLRDDQYPGYI